MRSSQPNSTQSTLDLQVRVDQLRSSRVLDSPIVASPVRTHEEPYLNDFRIGAYPTPSQDNISISVSPSGSDAQSPIETHDSYPTTVRPIPIPNPAPRRNDGLNSELRLSHRSHSPGTPPSVPGTILPWWKLTCRPFSTELSNSLQSFARSSEYSISFFTSSLHVVHLVWSPYWLS
jgi:hypothetical protein